MRSDRVFGLVWAVFFVVVGAVPLRHGRGVRAWPLVVGAVFLAAAIFLPEALRPLEVAWTRLGRVLHRVMTPVVVAVLWYMVFTPAGWLLRLFRKDPLRLAHEPAANTYWIVRRDREIRWGAF